MPHLTLRLTTDAPITYLAEEVPFILEHPLSLVLGPDASLTEPVDEISREFFRKTDTYWRDWTRHLALPYEWQEAVIRPSITLKLCNLDPKSVVAGQRVSGSGDLGGGRTFKTIKTDTQND